MILSEKFLEKYRKSFKFVIWHRICYEIKVRALKMNTSRFNSKSLIKTFFTLIELTIVFGIFCILISILLPSLKRAKEYAREIQCMNNIRQIAIGYNNYLNDYKTENPMPANGRFLDDMSIVYPYINTLGVFYCPSTKTERPNSPTDLEIQLKESGNSIILNSSVRDYLAAVYDEWDRIIYNGSQINQGHGTSSYGINPDSPSGNFDLSDAEKGVIYENCDGNHFTGYRNVIYVKDLHYVKYKNVSSTSEDYVWFLTLNKNGRISLSEVVKHNKPSGKK